jgi:putative membrane protein
MLAIIATVLGVILTATNVSWYLGQGWFQAKLALIAALIAYHWHCGTLVRRFAEGRNTRGHVFYRWFNEIPVAMLFGIVILVIVKPF